MNADEFTTFSDSEEEETGGPSREASPAPLFHSVGDFPLEQSRDDTLRWVFEQVIKIHDHTVHPDTVLTYPILYWLKIGCFDWVVTLARKRNTPSCWYLIAARKWFSQQLIIMHDRVYVM